MNSARPVTMAQALTNTVRAGILFLAITAASGPAQAQPTTAPPSSLPVKPLSPDQEYRNGPVSCDLCRPLEGRSGSDLASRRRGRDNDLHPHKKADGLSKSSRRSLRSRLPHRKLEPEERQ